MAKKLQISAKRPVSNPVPKTKKMKVGKLVGANTMKYSGPGITANTTAYSAGIGANLSQQLDFKEQQERGNVNAYDPSVGYFDVPVDASGKFTDTGANVARRLKAKKGKK